MNSEEHRAEAERLLAIVREGYTTGPTMSYQNESNTIAEAQVHATLAGIPQSQVDLYTEVKDFMIERLTEPAALVAFKAAWHEAAEAGYIGARVKHGMIAAIEASIL